MTETKTPAGRPVDHERPCFCEFCLPTTVMDLVHERAALFDAALLDGTYADWYERRLAEELIAGIPVAARAEVLEFMVTWDLLLDAAYHVLDECDERTYTVVGKMAEIMLSAIHEQGGEGSALRVLVTNDICAKRKLIVFDRQERAAGHVPS